MSNIKTDKEISDKKVDQFFGGLKPVVIQGYCNDKPKAGNSTFIVLVPKEKSSLDIQKEYDYFHSLIVDQNPDEWTYQDIIDKMGYHWYRTEGFGVE